MAYQKELIRSSGKLGNQVFYRSEGRDLSRSKPKKYTMHANSTKSGSEFGRGSTAGALIRRAFESMISECTDPQQHNRLAKRLREVICSGPAELAGERKVTDGNLRLLHDFDLALKHKMDKVARLEADILIDAGGLVTVNLPPRQRPDFARSAGAGCASIRIGIGLFDFSENTASTTISNELAIPLRSKKSTQFNGALLKLPFTGNGVLMVIISVALYGNPKYMALQIKDAVEIKDGAIVPFVDGDNEANRSVGKTKEVKSDVNWEVL
jgi:hypothetical protein